MREDIPHGKGVLVFGNGLGGGIQRADRGDRSAPASPLPPPIVGHIPEGLPNCVDRIGECVLI